LRLIRPPGPPNHGIVGNFPMGSKDPLARMTEWARQYGDIFYYRVLARHVYFLNHPDLIRYVLATDPQNFLKGDAIRYNRRIFGKGLVANEGESWAQHRRILQPSFTHGRIESYAGMMVASTMRMIDTWQDGESRDIHHDMMQLTLEIVARALFSVEIASEKDRISTALDTLMQLSTGARMLMPPLLRRIPTPGNLRLARASNELDRIVNSLIDERRASGPSSHSDVLDTLLQSRYADGSPLPRRQVRDEVMTLLLTGHETTAVALSWTWMLLSQNPDVELKLWSELCDVLGGRSPAMSDLQRLPYLDRVIKESLRLYPPAWALVRTPIKDCEIGGYRVPAGSNILISQWVMHRDPRYYDEPERFNPDRWLDERTKAAPRYAYFPFGGGPRSCIGAAFASIETALVLATIAQKFQVLVAPDTTVVPTPSITLRPRNGVRVVLTKRRDA
jgi:cytochrome P450